MIFTWIGHHIHELLKNRLTEYPVFAKLIKRLRVHDGDLAQLGERLPYKQRVSGSSPLVSTIRRLSSIGRATDL